MPATVGVTTRMATSTAGLRPGVIRHVRPPGFPLSCEGRRLRPRSHSTRGWQASGQRPDSHHNGPSRNFASVCRTRPDVGRSSTAVALVLALRSERGFTNRAPVRSPQPVISRETRAADNGPRRGGRVMVLRASISERPFTSTPPRTFSHSDTRLELRRPRSVMLLRPAHHCCRVCVSRRRSRAPHSRRCRRHVAAWAVRYLAGI